MTRCFLNWCVRRIGPAPWVRSLTTLCGVPYRQWRVSEYYGESEMRQVRQAGVLALLLLLAFAPAMACMLPAAQMTAQERACCRMMHNQCEQMDMSASHGCCQKTPGSIYAVPATKAETLHSVAIPFNSLITSELLNPFSVSASWVEHHDYSPPQSPSSTISILRI